MSHTSTHTINFSQNVEPYRRRGWSRSWFEFVVLMPVGSGDLFGIFIYAFLITRESFLGGGRRLNNRATFVSGLRSWLATTSLFAF